MVGSEIQNKFNGKIKCFDFRICKESGFGLFRCESISLDLGYDSELVSLRKAFFVHNHYEMLSYLRDFWVWFTKGKQNLG